MQGQSEALTSTEIVPNSYEYRYLTDEIVPLKNPVGEDITVDKKQGYRFEKVLNCRIGSIYTFQEVRASVTRI